MLTFTHFKHFPYIQMFSVFEKHFIRENLVLNVISVTSFCNFYGLKRKKNHTNFKEIPPINC